MIWLSLGVNVLLLAALFAVSKEALKAHNAIVKMKDLSGQMQQLILEHKRASEGVGYTRGMREACEIVHNILPSADALFVIRDIRNQCIDVNEKEYKSERQVSN